MQRLIDRVVIVNLSSCGFGRPNSSTARTTSSGVDFSACRITT
jgi:hypothetical protein